MPRNNPYQRQRTTSTSNASREADRAQKIQQYQDSFSKIKTKHQSAVEGNRQLLANRESSRTLNPQQKYVIDADRKAQDDAISAMYGASSGAPKSYVDPLTGKTIKTELTGAEKLQRLQGTSADDPSRRGGNNRGGMTYGSSGRSIDTRSFAQPRNTTPTRTPQPQTDPFKQQAQKRFAGETKAAQDRFSTRESQINETFDRRREDFAINYRQENDAQIASEVSKRRTTIGDIQAKLDKANKALEDHRDHVKYLRSRDRYYSPGSSTKRKGKQLNADVFNLTRLLEEEQSQLDKIEEGLIEEGRQAFDEQLGEQTQTEREEALASAREEEFGAVDQAIEDETTNIGLGASQRDEDRLEDGSLQDDSPAAKLQQENEDLLAESGGLITAENREQFELNQQNIKRIGNGLPPLVSKTVDGDQVRRETHGSIIQQGQSNGLTTGYTSTNTAAATNAARAGADATTNSQFGGAMDSFADIESRQRDYENDRIREREREMNEQIQIAEDEAEAQKAELEADAIEDKRDVDTEMNERIKRLKQSLAANGSITTDDEGNIDVEALALLDRVETDAREWRTEQYRKIDRQLDANIAKVDSGLRSTRMELLQGHADYVDQVTEAQKSREFAFDKMIAQKRLDLQSSIYLKSLEQDKTKYQLFGDKDSGYFAFNPNTAEVSALADAQGNNIASLSQGGSTVTAEDIPFLADQIKTATPTKKSEILANIYEAGIYDEFKSYQTDQVNERFDYDVLALSNVPATLRNSDEERKFFLEGLKGYRESGLTPYEAADRFLGFRPLPQYEALAEGLRSSFITSLTGEDEELKNIARLVNTGDRALQLDAVNLVELAKLKDVPQGKGITNKSLAVEAIAKGNEIVQIINEMEREGLLEESTGLIDAFTFKLIKGIDEETANSKKGKLATRLSGALVGLTSNFRVENVGSNVTDGELQFVEPLTASISDQPDILMEKVGAFVNNVVGSYNAARTTVNLPRLSVQDLGNPDRLIDIYSKKGQNVVRMKNIERNNFQQRGVINDNQTSDVPPQDQSPIETGQSFWEGIPRRGDAREDEGFLASVASTASNLGISPDDLMTVIGIETSGTFDPAIKNPKGSATGFIQFMPQTAESLGTTVRDIAQMDTRDQMKLVERYLTDKNFDYKDAGDVYLAIAAPAALGKPGDTIVYKKGTKAWNDNPGWRNADGEITVDSIRNAALSRKGQYIF